VPTFAETPGWEEFKQALITARCAPSMAFPEIVAPPIERQLHGPFRSHLDLPLLDTEEAARMEPVWWAIFELVRAHPAGCGCDPGVMAWRAAYAIAEVLLRLPDADGVYRRRYIGDVEHIYGWRCSRHDQADVRLNKAWDANTARKAYEAHMAAKHPEVKTDVA
jgi:hypothetical protein